MEELIKNILSIVTSTNTKVNDTDKKVDKLLQWKAGLDQKCILRGENLERINEVIYDRKNGIIIQVQKLLDCKKNIQSVRAFFLTILQKVLTWGAIAIIVWLLWLYKTNYVEKQEKSISNSSLPGQITQSY